jgi:hypothetical protein
MAEEKALHSDPMEPADSGGSADHQSVQVLSAYLRRALPAAVAIRVRRHVVLCPDCRDLLLDLSRFLEDRQGPHHHSAAEVKAAWKRLLASQRERPGKQTKTAGA